MTIGAVFFAFQDSAPAHAAPLYPQPPGGSKVYWTEFSADTVMRASVDGQHMEQLYGSGDGLDGPGAFALDAGTGTMYWSEENTSTIKRGPSGGAAIGAPQTIVSSVLTGGIALDSDAEKIYWTQSGNIRRANLDGTSPETYISGAGTCPLGIAYDASVDFTYWTDPCTNTIKRSGPVIQIDTLVSSGLSGPGGIALDTFAGKIYWVETTGNAIKRANLNGTGVETLISSGLNGPQDIAVDPVAGWMYWTESGSDSVRAAHLDGSNVVDVTEAGANPSGIDLDTLTPATGFPSVAIDPVNGHVYYTDFGTLISGGERLGRIRRANLDGTGQVTLVTRPIPEPCFPTGLALDLPGGKLYWTSADCGDVHRANLDGTAQESFHPTPMPSFPRAIAIDDVADKLYWTVGGAPPMPCNMCGIMRSNLDGTGEELWRPIPMPGEIQVDGAAGKVYWTESDPDEWRVMRANTNGTGVETLKAGPQPEPPTRPQPSPMNVALALDVAGGKMYVAWPQPNPCADACEWQIARYNLDGSGEETVLMPIPNPRIGGIAIGPTVGGGAGASCHPEGRAVEAGGGEPEGSQAGGTENRFDRSFALHPTIPLPHPAQDDMDCAGQGEIAGPQSKIYWTDMDGLHRANLNGSSPQLLIETPDTDGDGCRDTREQQSFVGSQTSGGRRGWTNAFDYMNPTGDGLNRIDDIVAVVNAYYEDDADDNPGMPPYYTGYIGNPPVLYTYNPDTDRTDDPAYGPEQPWRLLAGNGLVRIDDILAQIKQFFHDCA